MKLYGHIFKDRKHLLLISVFVGGIFLLFYYIIYVVFLSSGGFTALGIREILIAILILFFIFLYANLIDFSLSYLDTLNVTTGNWKRWIFGFVFSLVATLIITLVTFEAQPLPPQFDIIDSKYQQFLVFFYPNYLFSVIIYTVIEVWNSVQKNKNLQVSLVQAEKERIQSQLFALQQKVNPHFLFNSLSVLSELVFENPTKANTFIQEFTKVYRYVLQVKDETVVPIRKETEFVNSYAFLLKIRFGDNLNFKNYIDDDVMDFYVPPLSLQLLIENAIKHNEVSKAKPLFITMENSSKYILVTNGLQSRIDVTNSNGVGISNLKKTYHLISEIEPKFIKSKTEFIVKLPIIRHEYQ